MRLIWTIVHAWIDGVLTDATELSRRLALVGKPEDESRRTIYLKSLKRLLLITTLFPIPLLLIGATQNLHWLVASTGLFWAFFTLLLSIIAAPVGILLEVLLKGPKGSGKRYVNIVLWIFLVELTTTLFIAVVPLHNNIVVVPALLVASALLAVLVVMNKKGEKFKRIVGGKAAILFTFFTLSFFFPESFMALGKVREKIDRGIAAIVQKPSSLLPEITRPARDYPPCNGSSNYSFNASDPEQFIEVDMHPECWTGWITTPLKSIYEFQTTAKAGFEIEFKQDGYREWVPPDSDARFGKRRGIFRFRGEKGTMIVTFWYPDQDEEY